MNEKKRMMLAGPVLLLLGAVVCLLYRSVFAAAVDERGLLVHGSPAELALWALTAVAFAAALLLSRKTGLGEEGRLLNAACDLIFALGIASLFRTGAIGPRVLVLLYRICTGLAAASLAVSAGMRLMGRKPFFLLTAFPCALCVLQLVESYQLWSEVPQFLEYCFGVGGILCLTLTAYHRMSRSAGLPFRCLEAAFCLMSVFFCTVAVAQGDYPLFYGGGAVWSLAAVCGLQSGDGSRA